MGGVPKYEGYNAYMSRSCESGDGLTWDVDLVGEQEHAKLGAGANRWAARGPCSAAAPTGSTCSSLCLSITSIEVNS